MPGEVLRPDVLVGVLGAFLQRGEVGPVLPMLRPELVGIGAGEGEGGNADTVTMSARRRSSAMTQGRSASRGGSSAIDAFCSCRDCARISRVVGVGAGTGVQDRDLLPEVCSPLATFLMAVQPYYRLAKKKKESRRGVAHQWCRQRGPWRAACPWPSWSSCGAGRRASGAGRRSGPRRA